MAPRLAEFIATFCYVGKIPVCGGSAASALAIVGAYYLCPYKPLYLLTILLISVLGFLCSDAAEKKINRKDASEIVIDEVAGGLIAFFAVPLTLPTMLTGFFLFRAFDMFKIFPAYKFEGRPGGVGVMMDDIIAGIYTNLTLQIALKLSS